MQNVHNCNNNVTKISKFDKICIIICCKKYIKKTDNGIYKKYGKHIRKTDSHVFIVNNSDIFDKSDDIPLYYRHKSR